MTPDLPGIVQQIAHFENRLDADPGSRVFLPLADLYRRAGRLEEARRILERGLELHPGFLTASAALGLVLTGLGDGEEARRVLTGVLAADPDNLLGLRLLGREALAREAWVEACAHLERLLRLEPENREVRDGLRQARRALEQERPADAASTPDPGPMTPRSLATVTDAMGFETPTLAELYLRQGHPGKARVILERILAAEPEREDALAVLARLGETDHEARDAAAAQNGEAATPPAPARASAALGKAGRGDDLDRFRAWLDAAADQRGPAG